ncbi:MAG: hypothetical protein KME12_25660 [Trichocoleus desertorum ATA4-8-CV12]|jgi:hypothetical protein|nr:hypothetical protein [Trichocoleus desertorum ATA4-8-CV12]
MLTKNLRRSTLAIALSIGVLGLLAACTKGLGEIKTVVQGQLETSEQQHILVPVKHQAGECPETIKIWTLYLPIEGGVEHTAVPNIRPIAGAARLLSSDKQVVEYEAPLSQRYSSCIGDANSQEPSVYNFQFRNGKVYFRLDLNAVTIPTEITYRGIGGLRPYVRWLAGE